MLAKSGWSSSVKEKIRQLILLSKQNGYVTVQNINEFIPDSETDHDVIEEIMNILDGLDIKLLDEDEIETYRKMLEEPESKSAKPTRSYDPIDRYNDFFSKLGYRPLLKSSELNELVKRLEESETRALDFLFSCWLTLPFQLELSLKVLRKEERYARVVTIRKVESRDAYYRMLPKAADECTMLKAKIDKAWQKYLEEADPDKKSRAREAYRKIELTADYGCKDVLRKFCFKAKLFQGWLEGAEIKSDIEDAIQIAAAFSASSVQSSPGPAGWQALYVNRARDIERRWRLGPAELANLARNVRKYLAEADKAREEMVQYHSHLVSTIAESYQDLGVKLDELIDSGTSSLRSSIDDFNPSESYTFTHYAATGIRDTLLRLVAHKAGIDDLPIGMLEFIEIIPEVHAELKIELGRNPSKEELANEMNIAIDVMTKLLRVPGLDGLFLN